MKKLALTIVLGMISIFSYGQSYGDLFTTYRPAEQVVQSRPSYSSPITSRMSTIDIDAFVRRTTPQNIQMTTGIYLKGNSVRAVKLQVGILRRSVVVVSYWDGSMWNKSTSYASRISQSAPIELRQACMYETYISGLGDVYF